jgi:hypothetical protein
MNNKIKWNNIMNRFVFKKLFEIMGPLSSYIDTPGYREKETEAFKIIAKELTYLSPGQTITEEKVMMHVYKISILPILNPIISIILKLSAAVESGWMNNDDISRIEKYHIKKGMMIDLGNYYAIKKP